MFLRRGLPIVVAAALIAGAAAYFLSSSRPEEFEARSQVLLQSLEADPALQGVEIDRPDLATTTATNLQLATRRRLYERVADRPDVQLTADEVAESIALRAPNDTSVLEITATAGDGATAATLANAFAREFVRTRRAGLRDRLVNTLEAVESQYSALPRRSRRAEAGVRLRERIENYRTLRRVGFTAPLVAESAAVPSEAVAPRPRRDAVLGALFGAVLGLGLGVLFTQSDRRLRRGDEMARVAGVPLLAEVARARRGAPPAASAGSRLLHANLRYAANREPLRSVGLVSDDPNLARQVAEQLAFTAAGEGDTVLLSLADDQGELTAGEPHAVVDPDLPRLLVENVSRVPIGVGAADEGHPDEPERSVDVVHASSNDGAARSLDLVRFGDLLPSAVANYDFVVVHAPDLLTAPGAIRALSRLEGLVLVAEAGRTDAPRLQRLRTELDTLGLRVLGIVSVTKR
jgi:capsular polysaccharide biosynthesis protein